MDSGKAGDGVLYRYGAHVVLAFFFWTAASVGVLQAESASQFVAAKELCMEKYPEEGKALSGTALVQMARPFKRLDELSDHFLKSLSPTVAAYKITVWNPMSHIAGPRELFFALVIVGKQNIFLENDSDVVAYLNSFPSMGLSRSEAVDRVRAFIHLRSYSQPFFSGMSVQQMKYVGWSVIARLVTDAEANCRMDFTFDIQPDGHFEVKRRTFVSTDRYYQ